jgi:hypothetical protein
MAKGKRQKDKQYNGQRKMTNDKKYNDQRIKEKRTDNIMAKGKRQKDKQFNSQRYCLWFCSFPLAIILSVLLSFSFGHYIVCRFFVSLWPLYCLSFCCFPLAIILFVLLSFSFGHYIVCPLGQTI